MGQPEPREVRAAGPLRLMKDHRELRASVSTAVFCWALFLGAFDGGFVSIAQASSVQESAAQDPGELAELEKLRGLPRFSGELEHLERYGELTRLSPSALDKLLAAAGPGCMRQVIEALETPEDPVFSEARSVLVDRALGDYPAWVVSELRGVGAGSMQSSRRSTDALVVLELRGGAADLVTLRELVDPRDPEQRPDRVHLRAYETALSAILNRDRRAVRVLEDDWSEWPGSLWISTVKAVGGAGSPATLDLLTWLLQDADGTHAFLVQQIGRVAETSRLPGDFALHSVLIDYTSSQDAGLRREACVTLGKLQCSEAIDTLIARLNDPHAGVRESALWSLQTITGKSMKPELGRWRSWYAGEARWWRDDFPELREKLDAEDIAVVGLAIRELGRRKLRRHELAELLVPLLEDPREGVVCMTIAGLGALGSAVAVEPLIESLGSESEAVRNLALKALSSITGRKDLPAEQQAWSDPWRRL